MLSECERKTNHRRLDENRTEYVQTWTDAATGLQIRCVAIDYNDYPAVEWTVYLKNTGTKNTPVIEKIQGLDAIFRCKAQDKLTLHVK